MKKVLFIILLLAATINVHAYDFSAVAPNGQTLYYNITSTSTVEVTYPYHYYEHSVSYTIDDYYFGRKRIGMVKEDFLDFISEPKIRCFLDSRGTSY